jgi:hypothetical protein
LGVSGLSIEDELSDDAELDDLSEKFLEAIENAAAEELDSISFARTIAHLSNVDYARSMITILEDASKKSECGLEKREVIKGLILITWLQRIHSTIRSLLLGLVAAVILVPALLVFGSLSLLHNILLAAPILVSGIVVTRLLETHIISTSKKVVRYLSYHKRLRNFVMKYV